MNDMSQGQRQELTAEQQWEQFTALKTADDYIDSLRGRHHGADRLGEVGVYFELELVGHQSLPHSIL